MDVISALLSGKLFFGFLGLVPLFLGVGWLIHRSRRNYYDEVAGFDQEIEDYRYFDGVDKSLSEHEDGSTESELIDHSADTAQTDQSELAVQSEPQIRSDYLSDALEKQVTDTDILADSPSQPVQPAKVAIEPLVIVLHVRAIQQQGFNGRDIKNAMTQLDLEYGEMNIFHHYGLERGVSRQAVFSIANMLEPGSFENLESRDFNTLGLVLFMQLPGSLGGRVAFELMLNHAQRLAALLQAHLEYDQNKRLDAKWTDHLRQQIDTFELENKA